MNFCHYRKRIASPIDECAPDNKTANVVTSMMNSLTHHLNDANENTSLFYSVNSNLKRSMNRRISNEGILKNGADSNSKVVDYKDITSSKSTIQQSLSSSVTNLMSTVISSTARYFLFF